MESPESGKGTASGDRDWRDRWWVFGLLALVVWVGVRLLLSGLHAWPSALVGGVIYVGWLTWWMRRRRKRDARAVGTDADNVPGMDRRILKGGDVPDDPAEREAMARLVDRRQERLVRNRRWAFPLLAVIFFGTSGLWFAAGSATSGGVMLAAAVVFMSWMVWQHRRTLRRLEDMRRRLAEQPPVRA
ncbi:hypothetical protein [Streptomyces sp. NPDC059786]|uniref:hypothetical protein n=1 Tax=Streptomyces sp. NPDC059786 TaxID=3346946 RepID=UPI00365153D0